MLLQIGHQLCRQDNVKDLDDLRGLYADTGETDPALVAGTVIRTEEHQRHQEHNDDHTQELPLATQNIRVDNGKHDKGKKAQKHGEYLNNDHFCGVDPIVIGRGQAGSRHIDRVNAHAGTDQADDQ